MTSIRDFNRTVKYWKPDVAVVNTPGNSMNLKHEFPEVKAVWLDGEGFLPEEFSHAKIMSENRAMFQAPDMILLWGEYVKKQLVEAMTNEDVAKIKVVGNPTYDLIRFRNQTREKEPAKRQSVGVVMRFGTINNHEGIPPIRTLPNPDNLERVIVECRSFVGTIRAIQAVLDNTKFDVSLRPHPLEQIESYDLYKHYWFKKEHLHRVNIDATLSFSHWAREQRAILSPTSTSLLEAYLLKVPVINIDRLSGTDEFANSYDELTKTWQASGLQPSDPTELADILGRGLPDVKSNAALDAQIDQYCSVNGENSSSAYLCAKHIADYAFSAVANGSRRGLPMCAVDAIDRLSFWRAMRANPLHQNMGYRRGFHKLPDDLEEIAERIWGYECNKLRVPRI